MVKKKYYLQKMPYCRYWWTKSKTTVHDRRKSESFCLLTYYPFDGVDALHLLICNTIMNYKFITFVIHDTLAYDCFWIEYYLHGQKKVKREHTDVLIFQRKYRRPWLPTNSGFFLFNLFCSYSYIAWSYFSSWNNIRIMKVLTLYPFCLCL